MLFNLTYPNLNFAHKSDEHPIKNEEFEDHFHMIFEILLFIKGDAEFIIENKKFIPNPGDILFIPQGQHHNINIGENKPYERYVLKFPEYEIPNQLISILKTKCGCYSTDDTPIENIFTRLDSYVEHYDGVDLCGLLKCLLKEILYFSCSKESKQHEFEVYKENMIEVISYINENISNKICLEDICNHFHYSKSFICKEFQDCMDTPIMQYVRTKKILLAESLIKNGLKPVDIFEQCGFSDYSTFFRAYKKLLGKAPSSQTKKINKPKIV